MENYFAGLADDIVDSEMYSSLSSDQMSVPEFVCLLLSSPVPTSSLFASDRAVLRSAAASVLRNLLRIVTVILETNVFWRIVEKNLHVMIETETGDDENVVPYPSDAYISIDMEELLCIKVVKNFYLSFKLVRILGYNCFTFDMN